MDGWAGDWFIGYQLCSCKFCTSFCCLPTVSVGKPDELCSHISQRHGRWPTHCQRPPAQSVSRKERKGKRGPWRTCSHSEVSSIHPSIQFLSPLRPCSESTGANPSRLRPGNRTHNLIAAWRRCSLTTATFIPWATGSRIRPKEQNRKNGTDGLFFFFFFSSFDIVLFIPDMLV